MNKMIKIEGSSDDGDNGDIIHVPDIEESIDGDTKLAPVASHGDSASRSGEEDEATSSGEEDEATSSGEEDPKPRQQTSHGSGSKPATSRRAGLRNTKSVQSAPMPSKKAPRAAKPAKRSKKATPSMTKRAIDIRVRRDIEGDRYEKLSALIDKDILDGLKDEPGVTVQGKMYQAVLLMMKRIGHGKGGGTSTDTAGGKRKRQCSDNGDDNDSTDLDEVARLRKEQETLTETVAGLRAEKETLTETLAGLRAENEALTETVAWFQGEKEALMKTVAKATELLESTFM